MAEIPVAVYESKRETERSTDFVKMWLDALSKSESEEKDWRVSAENALEIYRGKKSARGRSFNILHSNVETLCPALYNSTPRPDVRRRYADPDPVAKTAGDMIERALSFSIDNYDFDSTMKLVIRDGEIVGRGVPRVRYTPTFGADIIGPDGQPVLDEQGQPVPELVYQEVTCDYVPWRYFRRGPGRTWRDIPWIAFGDFLSKDEMRKVNPELADLIPYNYSPEHDGKNKKVGIEETQIFNRVLVWQIWDKDTRKVISIAPDYADAPIAINDDPISVSGFFPTPRPYHPVTSTDSLTPVVPFEIYSDLVDELNELTQRITRLVKQVRPRGLYGGVEARDIAAWAEADDGELVQATNIQALTEGGGMDSAISWFPLDPVTKALNQLVVQREQVKQTIYEVTGLSDILRGASKASETATAQNIKQQWGSLRIQERQMEVARLARDLFRLKAEIIAGKFTWETLVAMTGIRVPTEIERQQARMMVQQFMQATQQAQASGQPGPSIPEDGEKIKGLADGATAEEVQKLLASDIARTYRIDIESDSTIRGDLTRNQQTMNLFLQGTSQFATAMAPIVTEFKSMAPTAMEIYSSFARHFKLGKQAEDALDGMADLVRKDMQQKEQGPPPDPIAEADKARAQMQMAQMQAEAAARQQTMQMDQQKMQMDQQKMQMEQAARQQTVQMEQAAAQQKMQMEQAAAQQKLQFDQAARSEELSHRQKVHDLETAAKERDHTHRLELLDAERSVKLLDIEGRRASAEAKLLSPTSNVGNF